MKTVAIVIGHKTTSPGATNTTTGTSEYEFNELLSRGIYGVLNHPSIEIMPKLIFRNNISYKELPESINNHNADLIISLHCNAYNNKTSGTEVLYYHRSSKGKAFAQQLQKQLVRALKLKDRGAKPITSEDCGGYLLKNTQAPCLIAEPFFIDNDDDLTIARNNMHQLVIAYAKGIADILVPKNGADTQIKTPTATITILPCP